VGALSCARGGKDGAETVRRNDGTESGRGWSMGAVGMRGNHISSDEQAVACAQEELAE
jgi:hypothetical protein